MSRRATFRICGVATLGCVALSTCALAQGEKRSAKDLIVGSWTLTIADDVTKDATRVPAFGPLPIGNAKFGADAHYSLDLKPSTGSEQPLSYSGTYTLDEPGKTLILHIEQSSMPAWSGTTQTGMVLFLTSESLGWTSPVALVASADFTGAELMWTHDQ